MEFFDCFSKSIDEMMLISGLEVDFMVLDMCVKFRVMYDFGSRDTGSNGVKNGVFLEHLEKFSLVLANFWTVMGFLWYPICV